MANKISQTIAKAFMRTGRTTEFDADIGNAMSLAAECEQVLRELCEHTYTYYREDADTANPTGLYSKVKRARALLTKMESKA